MGDNMVLRFQYLGKDTDVVVDDIDQISLIDLILEYWEISEKVQTPMPVNPGFSYIHKMKHVHMTSDNHLLKMFQDLPAASKSPFIEEDIGMDPPISPATMNDIVVDNADFWDNLEVTPIQNNMGRGRGRGKLRGSRRGGGSERTTPTNKGIRLLEQPLIIPTLISPPPPLTGELSQPTHNSSPPPLTCQSFQPIYNSPLFKKRIPKIAARRGLLSSTNLSGRGRGRVLASLSDDMDLVDSPYSPRNDESSDENEVSLENESDVESLGEDDEPPEDVVLAFIHDDFDPYEGPVWEDDCEDMDNYLQRLYKNGEFYKEKEFGKIEIKAWKLYTDKYHLRDVIRDYCIQSGFDVVVEWASRALMEDIRASNDISAKSLNKLLWTRLRVQMSKSTLYRAKQAALQQIYGGHDVSYTYLPAYCDAIIASNPNSYAQHSWYPPNHPERPLSFATIFICFKAALDGFFAGCRVLIGVDGAFLKGNYGEVLLSAVALDGNNEIFPIAWAIGSSEDEDTWKFFIWNLKYVLQQASGAYNGFTFKKAMDLIDKYKAGARVWLANLGDQDKWSKHKFNPSLKCDVNKTNFVESFNATLGIDRTCLAYLSGQGEFEIVDDKSNLPVSLKQQTCKCNQWQLTGIPCKHGMRDILYSGFDPLKFVHERYSVKRYKMAYANGISAIPDKDQCPETQQSIIEPPMMKRGVGRPVKNRRRGEEEQRKGRGVTV
ncbi:Alpha-methylacyl-CoA racemase [Bienertia sinuspersici]